MLQRLGDFIDKKQNESGLYEVCAGDSSNRGKWTKTGLCVDWFVRSMVCVPNLKVYLLAAFAGLYGVAPDRKALIGLTNIIVDLGDQMWQKVAVVRETKARDFILHDDTEEFLALLAITIEVMRWLSCWLLFLQRALHGTET